MIVDAPAIRNYILKNHSGPKTLIQILAPAYWGENQLDYLFRVHSQMLPDWLIQMHQEGIDDTILWDEVTQYLDSLLEEIDLGLSGWLQSGWTDKGDFGIFYFEPVNSKEIVYKTCARK